MDGDEHGPTALGKLAIVLFILACVAGGAYMFRGVLFPTEKPAGGGVAVTPPQAQPPKPKTEPESSAAEAGVEALDPKGITTVAEYKYVPQEKLPPVKGVSNYKWDEKERIVRFPINVWIGWLPIVAANAGGKPNAESIFAKKYGFQVDLKLIDDPVVARDAFASGDSHILWGTLDMMVLFATDLMKDSRTAPRIFQQVDWSNGGDGIVVRSAIKSVKDLKGKTVVYAQNSPSQYFLNNLLISAGMNPAKDVHHKYTATAFEAAAAFVSDRKIDACVSWAPDIYTIPDKVAGTRILTTTSEANKLIADVWAARADFAKDHPEVIRGLVAGIFDGMQALKDETTRAKAFQWMADLYGMKVEDVRSMQNDAHSTNFPENKEFFLNANAAANFERTWKNVTFVYRDLGLVSTPIRFDEVMDFSVLKALDGEGLFKEQKDEYVAKFVPTTYSKVTAEAPIITQTIRINFFPNSSNLYEPRHDELTGMAVQNTLYDPNLDATLEKVARLVGQYERAVVAVTGHTDSSMKGKVPYDAVKKLSTERAEAVKKALVANYKFDPNKFVVEGKGWDVPADVADLQNQALNRRVEISVYSPEQK